MAKAYTVTLDGKLVTLKYGNPDDRELVEGMFPGPDGTPGMMGSLVRNHLVGSGSLKVQTALVWIGVKHAGAKWTLERVREALAKAMQGPGIGSITRPTMSAILASGVLGKIFEEPEPVVEEDGGGKDETPTAT